MRTHTPASKGPVKLAETKKHFDIGILDTPDYDKRYDKHKAADFEHTLHTGRSVNLCDNGEKQRLHRFTIPVL